MDQLRWSMVAMGLVGAVAVACGPKKSAEPAAPLVGWHADEGDLGACYHPPDYDSLGRTDRRMMRIEALEAMMGQWAGERDDGVSFDETFITDIETILLRMPDKIEQLSVENLQHCKTAMSGKGMDDWKQWMQRLPRTLTAGECMRPLGDTMFYYYDLGLDWQFEASVCDDNVVRITASAIDEYKVDDDGPWINADGDPDKPATGDYPCNIEGCQVGQLVMRFRGDSGVSFVRPVGTELVFDPPEHGVIEVRVNDTTPYNNEYRVKSGVQHRITVTYAPVDD